MKNSWLTILICLTALRNAQAQAPVAEFSANEVSGCAAHVVSFRDLSTGNPKYWNWDFGNGQLSNLQNPTIAYSTPGTYTVTLVVRNDDGTHGITKTNYISVYPSPTARFIANSTIGCLPATIRFTDQSSPVAGTIVKWEWDFGDGTTSSDQHPTHTYTTDGFYTVSLRVTSSTGCSAGRSIGRYIRVVSGVIADFNAAAPSSCSAPFGVPFTNLSSGPGDMTYQWNFGNGNTSTAFEPSTTYTAAGNYQVTLTARSEYGCTGTITKPVALTGINTDYSPPASICLNTPATFTNNSSATPVSAQWDFGNGETSDQVNGTSTFTSPGTYSVLLINTYTDCIDSMRKNITVAARPPVNFSSALTISCDAPFTANFTDASPNAVSWLWDFGDGTTSTDRNPSHQYTALGSYTVSLTITTAAGCTNTLTRANYIRVAKPGVSIANVPNGGCIPFTFQPIANVSAVDGVRSYLWTFGNGATSTLARPSVTYTTVGTFTITLQITTNDGCVTTTTATNAIETGTPPVANFTIVNDNVCASTPVAFRDQSTHPNGVDEWRWDFGDGQTSDQQNPSHHYRDTGNFTVSLTAYSNRCGGVSTTKTVHVKPPVASFDDQVNCSNQRVVTFTNNSKADPAITTTYTWDFGDGSAPSNAVSPAHTYATLGSYTVRLTASGDGCTHSVTRSLRLLNEPVNFEVVPANPCRDQRFTISSIDSDPNNISRYRWRLDAGVQFDSTRSFDTSFSTLGVHNIRLVMNDLNGCAYTKNGAVTVTGPTARFTAANLGGCQSNTITFNDASTPAGNIRKWTFDFGDGKPPVDFNAPPFSYQYSDSGRFVVKLTVEDNNGCTHTYELPDTLHITKLQPGFSASYTTVCKGVEVQFKDTSAGNNTGNTFEWDFGDGTPASTQQHPSHIYNGPDSTYTVKFYVSDPAGCLDSVVRTNYITVKNPKPAFTVTDTATICQLLETHFTFQGQDYESFYWDFGDGSSSTLQDPRHFYNDYGTYTAKLYLIGYGGCLESASQVVHVYNPFRTTVINFNPRSACNSLNVDFSITTPPTTTFTFLFGDGSQDNSQAKTFQHFYKQPGSYAPSMLLRDETGCQVTIGAPARIEISGALPLFGIREKKNFCDTGKVYFTNYTIGNQPVQTRVWDFGDGSPTTSEENPTHTYRQPGTFSVSHTVTTTGGCTNTIRDTIRIYATPTPSIVGRDTVCLHEALPLQGVLAVPDTAITWTWNLGSGGTGANDPNTSVTYHAEGVYTVSLQAANKLGCKKDPVTKQIVVPPLPVINVANDPVIPMGGGIDLPVSYSAGIATYLWSPPASLSCSECAVPFANPKATTKYNVKVTDNNGCTASKDITVTVVCNNINYFVPNTFSPNKDGHNDVFYPRGTFINRISGLRIFNRWGELIFEKRNFAANDASAGWDGTFKGKPADPDVYIYMIEFICENGAIVPYKGNVTLLR